MSDSVVASVPFLAVDGRRFRGWDRLLLEPDEDPLVDRDGYYLVAGFRSRRHLL